MTTVTSDGRGPLGQWYGTPLTTEQAQTLLATVEQRRSRARSRRCRTCGLQALVAHFWLGDDISDDVERLHKLFRPTAHGTALLELIYGQLLMSRRLAGARLHLHRGFLSAARLLAPDDYFTLLKRHQLLARLPLAEMPLPPADLPALLTTAAVISRMEPPARGPKEWDSSDTYG